MCKVVKETMTTNFSSISGSRVEDLPIIVADINGLSPSKKMRSGDSTVDELADQSVSSAHCKALERKDSNTALQLGSLLMGTGITRKDIQKAHPDCSMSSRQFTGLKQHAKRVSGAWGSGSILSSYCQKPRSQSEGDYSSCKFLHTRGSDHCQRKDSQPGVIPLVNEYRFLCFIANMHQCAIDYLLDRFIGIQETVRGIAVASKDAPRSKKGERLYIGLQRVDMRLAIRTVCPTILKSLAALDTTSETSGRCVIICGDG
jgi:hypothetical protein